MHPTKFFTIRTENRAPAFKATSSGILKSFLINIHPVENLHLIGLCQILSCVFFFLPLFRFSSFPGLSVFTAFAFFFLKEIYGQTVLQKNVFRRLFY